MAISLLILYIKERSRCLRTADFSIDVRSDYIGHTIEASAKGRSVRATRRIPGVGVRNVDLTSLWRPLNYVQDRMLYSHIVVVSDVYVFFSKYLYKITLFSFLYSLLPNCNENSAHFQANSTVNFV